MAAELAKTLTETDVEKSLQVPAEWLVALPPLVPGQAVQQLWVTDGLGFFWEFFYVIVPDYYQIDGIFYCRSQAVLQPDEWRRFVDYKGLKAGDRLVLETPSHCVSIRGIKYRLKAQKLDSDGVSWLDL